MIKVGRPKSDGVKRGWELFRALEVLLIYTDERAKGTKYDAAVHLAIEHIKEKFPGMPISRSSVKRIIAMTCNKKSNTEWRVSKQVDPLTGKELTSMGFEQIRQFESAYKKRLATIKS